MICTFVLCLYLPFVSLELLRIEQLRDSGINSNTKMQRSELVNTLSSQQIDSYSIAT